MRIWQSYLCATMLIASPASAEDDQKKAIPKHLQRLLAFTKGDFTRRITLKDDSLETEATLSTLQGWKHKEGLLGIVNSDQFFRVFINKKTGVARYQAYQYIAYTAPRYAKFVLVNFDAKGGPEQKELDVLGRIIKGCSRSTGCARVEHVAFTVDDALIRSLAAKYDPAKPGVWRYRLKAKSGVERDEGFSLAEVAAVVQAVDDYGDGKRF